MHKKLIFQILRTAWSRVSRLGCFVGDQTKWRVPDVNDWKETALAFFIRR